MVSTKFDMIDQYVMEHYCEVQEIARAFEQITNKFGEICREVVLQLSEADGWLTKDYETNVKMRKYVTRLKIWNKKHWKIGDNYLDLRIENLSVPNLMNHKKSESPWIGICAKDVIGGNIDITKLIEGLKENKQVMEIVKRTNAESEPEYPLWWWIKKEPKEWFQLLADDGIVDLIVDEFVKLGPLCNAISEEVSKLRKVEK